MPHQDFWRDHLRRVGARVPRELGRWEESAEGSGVWRVTWSAPLGKRDVVIKVLDPYLPYISPIPPLYLPYISPISP